jgi:hypothetical protein
MFVIFAEYMRQTLYFFHKANHWESFVIDIIHLFEEITHLNFVFNLDVKIYLACLPLIK